MKQVLDKHSYITGKLRRNRKLGRDQHVRMLTKSKRRIFREHPEIHAHMNERAWYNHLNKFCSDYRKSTKKSYLLLIL